MSASDAGAQAVGPQHPGADPECLFCKIVAGDLPSEQVYASEEILGFRDIHPQAPTHVVLVTRQHFADAGELAARRPELAGALLSAGADVARQEGIAERGYRLLSNTGEQGGQTVFHVHLHVLGGRQLGALG